jgi:hypothetical protein
MARSVLLETHDTQNIVVGLRVCTRLLVRIIVCETLKCLRNSRRLTGMTNQNDVATDYETMTIVRKNAYALLNMLGNTPEARDLIHDLIMGVDECNRRALDVQDVIDDLE